MGYNAVADIIGLSSFV